MSNQASSNPLVGMAVNFVTNPWVMAGLGGAAGYYFFGRKDGKTIDGKRPYIAAGVGAAAGLAAGKLIQSMRTQQAQIAPAQQPAQVAAQQAAQQEAAAQGDYYSMENVATPDVDEAFGQAGVPLQADMEAPVGLGSLEGTNLGSEGLGSLGREVGFDAYDPGIDEAINEASRNN